MRVHRPLRVVALAAVTMALVGVASGAAEANIATQGSISKPRQAAASTAKGTNTTKGGFVNPARDWQRLPSSTGGTRVKADGPTDINRDWFTIKINKLVMKPQAQGGSFGELTVDFAYVGTRASVTGVDLMFNSPKGTYQRFISGNNGPCLGNQQSTECHVSGTFRRGETHQVTLGFIGIGEPKDFARIAADGWIRATYQAKPAGPFATAGINAVLASKSGSVDNPQPYAPSTSYDMALSASTIQLTRATNGVWTATMDLTATYKTDAYNVGGWVDHVLPGGKVFPDRTEPEVVCAGGCELPGWVLYEGQPSTIRYIWTLPANTAPGVYTGWVNVHANANNGTEPDDATPADNIVQLSVTIPA